MPQKGLKWAFLAILDEILNSTENVNDFRTKKHKLPLKSQKLLKMTLFRPNEPFLENS